MKHKAFDLSSPIKETVENNEVVEDMCDLSDLNDAYLFARDGKLKSGKYTGTIIKARVQKSRAGNRQVVWDVRVEIPLTGFATVIKKFNPLTEKGMYWLHRDLTILGIVLPDLNHLPEALHSLTGTTVEVSYKAEGSYPSVSFNRVISVPREFTQPEVSQ
jgi:hypothetical protein